MISEIIGNVRNGVNATIDNLRNARRRQISIVRGAVKPVPTIQGTLGRRFTAISRTGERVLGTTRAGSFEKIGDRSK
jgi:hypothetical protein